MVKAMMMMTTMTIVVIIDDDNNDDGHNNYNKITICGRAGVVKGRENANTIFTLVRQSPCLRPILKQPTGDFPFPL